MVSYLFHFRLAITYIEDMSRPAAQARTRQLVHRVDRDIKEKAFAQAGRQNQFQSGVEMWHLYASSFTNT